MSTLEPDSIWPRRCPRTGFARRLFAEKRSSAATDCSCIRRLSQTALNKVQPKRRPTGSHVISVGVLRFLTKRSLNEKISWRVPRAAGASPRKIDDSRMETDGLRLL
jgi:hypothetical protein